MFDNKIICITWWTWTWWQAITQSLLQSFNVKKIIIISRWEDKQVNMERSFNNKKLSFVLCDVRNKWLLKKITKGVDFLIHAAALKHITKCEENQEETVSINVQGTQNIVDISIENNIKKVLYISTDKAVEPYNLYGRTKALGENIIIHANTRIDNKTTNFFTLRAGNILWSNWSVLSVFRQQVQNKVELTVTDLSMKRFYISIKDITDFILYIFQIAKWWEIFIPKCVVLSLKDILDIIMSEYWVVKINEWGIKKWEKKDEVLITTNEIDSSYQLNDKYLLIDSLWKHMGHFKQVDFNIYSTNSEYSKNNSNSLIKIEQDIISLLWK